MPTSSKCPRRFLERFGRIPTERRTRPRQPLGLSRANSLPLEPEQLNPDQVLRDSGLPDAGGGVTQPWPPEQQVIPDE